MKTEAEISKELKTIRKALAKARRDGSEEEHDLWTTQQALGWVLGELMAPSDFQKMIRSLSNPERQSVNA